MAKSRHHPDARSWSAWMASAAASEEPAVPATAAATGVDHLSPSTLQPVAMIEGIPEKPAAAAATAIQSAAGPNTPLAACQGNSSGSSPASAIKQQQEQQQEQQQRQAQLPAERYPAAAVPSMLTPSPRSSTCANYSSSTQSATRKVEVMPRFEPSSSAIETECQFMQKRCKG